MADMYEYDNTCSSSSPPPPSSSRPGGSATEPDEISLFLHQILLRSSSSPSSSSLMTHNGKQMQSFPSSPSTTKLCNPKPLPENPHRPCQSPLLSYPDHLVPDKISTAEPSAGINSSSGLVFSSTGVYFPVDTRASDANMSSSVGAFDNDLDEYDCESEEGFEALVEEVSAKPGPHRNSSKRSRAAEVHNLSEKRRRSRINEKMKALQNLIPNSNKTDKASMLDEAIEYLKQLQLQVQMLSMRNGLSLHPMCLPGVLQPIQLSQMTMGFGEGNGSLHMNMTGTLPMNQETGTQTAFSLPNQCTPSNQSSLPNMSNITNSDTSFGLESSIQAHLGPFQLHTSSEEICREDMLPHPQLNVNYTKTNPLEFKMGVTVSLPFDTRASDLKDSNSLEACVVGRDRSEGMFLKNIERNQILSPNLNGMHAGRSAPKDDVEIERLKF